VQNPKPATGWSVKIMNEATRFGLFLLLTVGAWGQQADMPKSFTPPTGDYDCNSELQE
jgi:hypothetical protein